MFAYINGTIADKANNYVVIDVGGIGYKIFMSQTAIEKLPEIGEKQKVGFTGTNAILFSKKNGKFIGLGKIEL